ncbi:hypothetical protein CMUS01_11835 [Colletotrichum musicola]|uniref:Uncharacterized protein n=1 Tax=Colletotrichum musicola TaxID=2175873 RepID=A0A8H6N3D3_9PEZI|nr:hypothetical protein CMUS01_11835 [Colletotrichum musicola]
MGHPDNLDIRITLLRPAGPAGDHPCRGRARLVDQGGVPGCANGWVLRRPDMQGPWWQDEVQQSTVATAATLRWNLVPNGTQSGWPTWFREMVPWDGAIRSPRGTGRCRPPGCLLAPRIDDKTATSCVAVPQMDNGAAKVHVAAQDASPVMI